LNQQFILMEKKGCYFPCRDYPPLVLVRGKRYSMLSMKARKIRWQNRKPIHSLSLFD